MICLRRRAGRRRGRSRPARSAALTLCLLAGVGACRPEPTERPALDVRGPPPGASFRDVVESVLPSIVFIQTEITPPPGIEQLLPGLPARPQEPLPLGMGSGVLISDDGLILTNNHVVQDAERVMVMLHDRRFFEAEVIARDPSTEVAVIRIPANGLSPATLGDSDQVGLGDWVLAMGSPLGLQFSVTAGIVSGTGRDIGILGTQAAAAAEQAAPLEHFIQTDAALSPGNSGGPLVNAGGEVIGINTAVAAGRGGPGAYGFAIPSNLARRVADQLVRHGEVRRPYLGVLLRNVTPQVAREQGLQAVEGAQIVELEAGSPADAAGMAAGDIIVGLGERRVQSVSDLQAALLLLEPGTRASVQALRDGARIERDVELGVVRSGVGPGPSP